MGQINIRIRKLRLSEDLTQADFGEKLGMSKNEIYNLESGRTKVKESDLKLITSTFKVNENWLRTGLGEIYEIASENITKAEAFLAIEQNEKLAKAVLKFSKLTDEQLEALLKIQEVFKKD